MKKNFLHRHKILQVLQKHNRDNSHPNSGNEDLEFYFHQLLKASGLSDDEIIAQIDYLHNEDEIYIASNEKSEKYCIISRKGTEAFYDDKYLKESRKDRAQRFLTNFKVLSTPVVLMLTVGSFIITVVNTCQTNSSIKSVRSDMDSFRRIITTSSATARYQPQFGKIAIGPN